MRRIFAFMMVTLDGYHEGPNHEFDFWIVDDAFSAFSVEQLDEVDTLVFGRVTYEGMAAYWPTPAAKEADAGVRTRMNSLAKVVISRTLERVEWANTRIVRSPEELATLKQAGGGDMAILGSSELTASLMEAGLVDELRVMLSPVILGAGRSVFRTAGARMRLRLLESRTFDSGNVLLRYQVTTP